MNIILVGKPFTRPKTIELTKRSVQLGLAATLVGGAALLVGLSFWLGQAVGDVRGVSRQQMQELRTQLADQQLKLAHTEERAQNNINALASELGELQAHASRLNAFGQRLTRVGKMDDGEFAFDQPPATGGPDTPVAAHFTFMSSEFGQEIDQLRRQFQSQDQQLTLLESLLIDRDLDNSLLPKGMPVRTGYVSSGFGYRTDPIKGGSRLHEGVDFAGPYGSEVLAVASGVVTWAGARAGYGQVVEIDHGNGYKTRYAHNSKNLVTTGDVVEAGQHVAKMGSTGRSTGSHVHFEVWFDNKPVNPKEFVAAIR